MFKQNIYQRSELEPKRLVFQQTSEKRRQSIKQRKARKNFEPKPKTEKIPKHIKNVDKYVKERAKLKELKRRKEAAQAELTKINLEAANLASSLEGERPKDELEALEAKLHAKLQTKKENATQKAETTKTELEKQTEETETHKQNLSKFLTALAKENQESKAAYLKKFASMTNIEQLQQAGVTVAQNMKNIYDKHVKLAAAFLTKEGEGLIFSVDLHGIKLAESGLKAAHMLPPEAKAISIYDENGEIINKRVERKIVDGKLAYYTKEGEPIEIHTGYLIKILETRSQGNKELAEAIKEEQNNFSTTEKRREIRNNISSYIQGRFGKDILVDDRFITQVSQKLANINPDDPNFGSTVINKAFSQNYLQIMRNIAELHSRLNISDIKRFEKNGKLKTLWERNLTEDEVTELINKYDHKDKNDGEKVDNHAHNHDHNGDTHLVNGSKNKIENIEYTGVVPKPILAKRLEGKNWRSRRGKGIKEIILHDGGTWSKGDKLARYLASKNSRGVSSHFTICRDGRIIQTLDESKQGIHTVGHNISSIGIDFANKNVYYVKEKVKRNGRWVTRKVKKYEPYTEAQYKASSKLIAHLVTTYNIPLQKIMGHRHTKRTTHSDPSPVFNWDKMNTMVQGEIKKYGGATIAGDKIDPYYEKGKRNIPSYDKHKAHRYKPADYA